MKSPLLVHTGWERMKPPGLVHTEWERIKPPGLVHTGWERMKPPGLVHTGWERMKSSGVRIPHAGLVHMREQICMNILHTNHLILLTCCVITPTAKKQVPCICFLLEVLHPAWTGPQVRATIILEILCSAWMPGGLVWRELILNFQQIEIISNSLHSNSWCNNESQCFLFDSGDGNFRKVNCRSLLVINRYRNDYEIGSEEDVFNINEKHEVSVNASCCKGVVSLVGKGGAIRVQKGSVNIRNWWVRFCFWPLSLAHDFIHETFACSAKGVGSVWIREGRTCLFEV